MRKLLLFIAIASPVFGQALTHIVDTAYFAAGDQSTPGTALKANCTLSISGQSNGTTVSISGTTFFPVTVKWAVTNGIVNGYLPPNLNGTSFAVSGSCQPPYPTSFIQVWSIPATASLPYCPSIGGVVTCVLQGVIQPAPYATISQAVTAPTTAPSGYIPAWGLFPALTSGFPLVTASSPNSVVETNNSGVLDWSFIQPLTGVVQGTEGITSLTSPSGNGSAVMTGVGPFTDGCATLVSGNVKPTGQPCNIGSVTGPSLTTSGYLVPWANATGTLLGQGFPVSSTSTPNVILQLLGTGFASPTIMPAFSGVITTTAGGTVATFTHPTGTGSLVCTGSGTYTPGDVILVGPNRDCVDGGFPPGSGTGNVTAAGITGVNAVAVWSSTANALLLGPNFSATPSANIIPETGGGGMIANGFIQTASGSQIGLGNVLQATNQTAVSYGSGSATVGLANPLMLPGPATLAASTTGGASLVLPNGTAPTNPTVGMIWSVSGVPYYYNGSAVQSFVLSGLDIIAQSPLTGGTQALTGNVTLGVQSASGSQIGAGNVIGTANELAATYSGGSATLTIASPFVFPGPATLATSTTGASGFNIPSGSAPTSPNQGDLWNQSGTLYFHYGSNQSVLTSTSTAGGNASGTFGSLIVTEVNGVSYPASPSTSGVPVVTAANTATYLVLPACPDSGGNHLNWTGTAWFCGTTGGTAGSVAFSGVLAGTNTTGLTVGSGGSLTFSGSGTINASNVNGVAYPAVPGSTGMVPVVTSLSGTGAVTYEAGSLTIASVANQTTISGCGPVALAGTCTVGTVQSIGTASSPIFAGLTIGSSALASAGAGTSTFPAVTGTVVTTGTSGLVTNAMLASSAITIMPSTPMAGGGPVSLGGTATLSIATASASQIGAGNVGTSAVIAPTYSGGSALLAFVDPTVFNIIDAATLNLSGNATVSGSVASGNGNNGRGTIQLNNIDMITASSVNSGGSSFSVGSRFQILGGVTPAVGQVTAVSGGVVTGYTLSCATCDQGTGFAVTTGATTITTSGGGSGLTVNITGVTSYALALSAPSAGFDYAWNHSMGGDISGYPWAGTVIALQGNNISTNNPGNGQFLQWSVGTLQWTPATLAFTQDVTITSGFAATVQGFNTEPLSPTLPSAQGQIYFWNAGGSPAAYWGLGGLAQIEGTLTASGMPALIGDVHSAGGSLSTTVPTIGSNTIAIASAIMSPVAADSATAIQFAKHNASTVVVDIDTSDSIGRFGLCTAAPGAGLDVECGSAIFGFAIQPNVAAGTLTGSPTSGTVSCYTPITGSAMKVTYCTLSSYVNTGTAQTYTVPANYQGYPLLTYWDSSGNTCGTYSPSYASNVITLPANASMTAESCTIKLDGR